MIRRLILLILLYFVCGGRAIAAGDRDNVALVIANGNYANAGTLANPINDGQLVAASLRKAGFGSVVIATDVDRAKFERALRDFRQKAAGAYVAMIYYAGHGIEENGRNWLVPVDAALASSADLPYEAIDLDLVMDAISGAHVRMVVLDACRNSPFARNWRYGSRSAPTRGLARIEADDVMVIYAAAPGQTATDGDGGNSPFARSLAARLDQPGLAIQMLGGLVRDDVMAATNNVQRPFVSSSITGTPVYLSKLAAVAAASDDVPMMEALAWQGALNANTREGYEDYLDQYPKGRFVKLAKQNIKRVTLAEKRGLVPEASAPIQYASIVQTGGSPPQASSVSAAGAAASAPQPDQAHVEDAASVAALNMRVQAHNDAIARQNQIARDAYQSELRAVDQKTRLQQEAYARQIADFQHEQEKWRERVRACEEKKADVCADAAAIAKPRKLNPSEMLTWREALVVCKPSGDLQVATSACEGPLWSGPVLLGSADGDALLLKACGSDKGRRDLGTSGGMRVFGCGYGIHPEDPDGQRPGNADIAAKLGLEMVAGRASFHCARKTASFCRAT